MLAIEKFSTGAILFVGPVYVRVALQDFCIAAIRIFKRDSGANHIMCIFGLDFLQFGFEIGVNFN